jgi:preprotein translocase subunit SecY
LKNLQKIKKNNLLFLFSIVTIYRLYHTHSLGSVEPTIALSESLWSRIVTQNKKKKKSENQKFQKKKKKNLFASVFVFVVLFMLCYFPIPMMN